MKLKFPIIDLHVHLRNDIAGHSKIAKNSGIDVVVYMANCQPPLDNLKRVKKSLRQKRNCIALPVAAITKNLDGQKLVDVEKIKDYVIGFSDDGKYIEDLSLIKEILEYNVLVFAHCCPPWEVSVKKPYLETKFVEKYLKVFEKTDGKLHIQHVSKKETVDLIRAAKKDGLKITCETCPHYFTFTKDDLEIKVNPPLGDKKDIKAIKEGLADGTIDVIATDYAPLPRITGLAGFSSFLPLSLGLVLGGIITEKQLEEKIYINPKKIIESSGYKLNL